MNPGPPIQLESLGPAVDTKGGERGGVRMQGGLFSIGHSPYVCVRALGGFESVRLPCKRDACTAQGVCGVRACPLLLHACSLLPALFILTSLSCGQGSLDGACVCWGSVDD